MEKDTRNERFVPVQEILRFTRIHEIDKKDVSIIANPIGDSMIIFTLHGRKIEDFLVALLEYRAADQRSIADSITKNIFSVLFKPEVQTIFNVYVTISRDAKALKIRELALSTKDEKEYIAALRESPVEYYKYEIDGIILLTVSQDVPGNSHIKKLVEIKLYTVPEDDAMKVLVRHLQKKVLINYFSVRDYLGLLGFSYLIDLESGKPVLVDPETESYPNDIPSIWAVHLVLIDRTILHDNLNAPARARLILDVMKINSNKILKIYGLPENINFKPTSNLIKVMYMSSLYYNLKKKYERAVEELNDYKRIAEEEQRKREEEQRKREEEQRKREEEQRK
ncbi:MAG: hypothetical protein ACTSRA_21055, partial [Promethearchaeota archaeon]